MLRIVQKMALPLGVFYRNYLEMRRYVEELGSPTQPYRGEIGNGAEKFSNADRGSACVAFA